MDWILKVCNMAFESGVVAEDCRSAMIDALYKSKEERTEYSNYRGISLLKVVGKIYIRKVTKSLIDDGQGGYRAERGYVDQILTLKQIGEKV